MATFVDHMKGWMKSFYTQFYELVGLSIVSLRLWFLFMICEFAKKSAFLCIVGGDIIKVFFFHALWCLNNVKGLMFGVSVFPAGRLNSSHSIILRGPNATCKS